MPTTSTQKLRLARAPCSCAVEECSNAATARTWGASHCGKAAKVVLDRLWRAWEPIYIYIYTYIYIYIHIRDAIRATPALRLTLRRACSALLSGVSGAWNSPACMQKATNSKGDKAHCIGLVTLQLPCTEQCSVLSLQHCKGDKADCIGLVTLAVLCLLG